MPILLELRGLQASGKSTYARNLVYANNWVRVNRDDLREQMFNSKWSQRKEDVIRDAELAIAEKAIRAGFNVVVDDTNLSKSAQNMWSSLKSIFAYEPGDVTHTIEFIDTPVDECIKRDYDRSHSVGRSIIEQTALRYGLLPELKDSKPIVFVDIDGTIADLTHRRQFVTIPDDDQISEGNKPFKKDWDSFFNAIRYDKPIQFVIDWVNALYNSGEYYIFLLSGRNTNTQQDTLEWLYNNGVNFHRILMRNASDHRPDFEVKSGFMKMFPKDKIAFAIDDRPQVVELVWRLNGIRVFQVNTWEAWPQTEHDFIKKTKERLESK